MNILQQKLIFFQEISQMAPKQLKKLFQFGLEAFTLQTIFSMRANARVSLFNWPLAKTKVCRLAANMRIPNIFPKILKHLGIVGVSDFIALDFSDFGNGLSALMFAKQTYKGRALPVYFETFRPSGNWQNVFIISAIQRFVKVIGFKPLLVMDRGFACPDIVRFLDKNGFKLVVRVKGGKEFAAKDKKFKARVALSNDIRIRGYCRNLRLVVSGADSKHQEPWYLVTNLEYIDREGIIAIYYYRFEIEEFFKDAKHLLGMERLRVHEELSLTITLWFAILTTWFLWRLEAAMNCADEKLQKEMQISKIRYCWEALQREILRLSWLAPVNLLKEELLVYGKV